MPPSRRTGSPSALRSLNRDRIIDALRAAGELSQADLARATGLSPATVSNIVTLLVQSGAATAESLGGRRKGVRLTDQHGFVVGIDFGHRHLAVAVADQTHRVLAHLRHSFAEDVSADDGLDLAATLARSALEKAGVRPDQVLGSAVGVPAPIDQLAGTVGSLSILPGWVGVDIRTQAAARLNLPGPCPVDNDANLGAYAEHLWGAGVGTANMAYLKLSEGVGAGLIVDGRLYGGPQGTAGEIGHTTVDEFGEVCRCGNRGCLETLVSARRVISLLSPTHGPDLTISKVVYLARRDDRACARVLHDAGMSAGRAIADLCSLLNPELIVVGGELAQAKDLLISGMRQMIDRCGVPAATSGLAIRTAALGPRSQLLGAVARALSAVAEPA